MIENFKISSKYVLDKTTVIYGETNTGKSSVIKDILFHIKDRAEQIIVISPTDMANHTYEKTLVPKPCIHYKITGELLDNILQRQTALVSVYERANNKDILHKLFQKIPDIEDAKKIVKTLNEKPDLSDTHKEMLLKVYHKYINQSRSDLAKLELTNDERFSLNYFDMNPRLVLIFDDCTEYLQKFKKHEALQSFFYRGRWGFLTVIIACHTDKSLDPELKKNTYLSIYTGRNVALTCLTRKSMNLTGEELAATHSAIDDAFDGMVKHQKLVWSRMDNKYYKYYAESHPDFRFGSNKLWEFCDKIKITADYVNTSNKFIREFII